jgi:GNAT superfamily N-acetyltransferase
MDIAIAYLADCPETIPQLAAWQQGQFGYLSPAVTVADRIARFKTHLQGRAIPTTFVALHNGAPAGSASLVVNDMESLPELTPWLAGVYVSPEHRGCGLGGRLVRRVMEEAAALGVSRLYLYTHDRMTFYRNMDWQVIGPRRHRGYLVTVMSYMLSA